VTEHDLNNCRVTVQAYAFMELASQIEVGEWAGELSVKAVLSDSGRFISVPRIDVNDE
jgi:hypothetical protein